MTCVGWGTTHCFYSFILICDRRIYCRVFFDYISSHFVISICFCIIFLFYFLSKKLARNVHTVNSFTVSGSMFCPIGPKSYLLHIIQLYNQYSRNVTVGNILTLPSNKFKMKDWSKTYNLKQKLNFTPLFSLMINTK